MSRMQIADVEVRFAAAQDAAFDYLTDPSRRPRWQSSLRTITGLAELGDHPGDVGTAWRDVTMVPGVTPSLEVIECIPHRRWTEIGNWHNVDARLTLDFAENVGAEAEFTLVRATATLTIPAAFSPALILLRAVTPQALRADLRRAAAQIGSCG